MAGVDWMGTFAPRSNQAHFRALLVSGLSCWIAFVTAAVFAEFGRARSNSSNLALLAMAVRTGGVAIAGLAFVVALPASDRNAALFCLLLFYGAVVLVDTLGWVFVLMRGQRVVKGEFTSTDAKSPTDSGSGSLD